MGRQWSKGWCTNKPGGDEVEDLFQLLVDVKRRFPEVTAVCSGAILSTYQRLRVESVCSRLGLTSLAYLWQRDQAELLRDMLASEVDAILVKTASFGLEAEAHLGERLAVMEPVLHELHERYGVHVCGEGGEYETLVLDAPIFKRRLVLDETKKVLHSEDAAVLVIKQWHTEAKCADAAADETETSTPPEPAAAVFTVEPPPTEDEPADAQPPDAHGKSTEGKPEEQQQWRWLPHVHELGDHLYVQGTTCPGVQEDVSGDGLAQAVAQIKCALELVAQGSLGLSQPPWRWLKAGSRLNWIRRFGTVRSASRRVRCTLRSVVTCPWEWCM